MKIFFSLALLASGFVCSFSQQQDVVDIARSIPESFSLLVALVTKAKLVDALKDPSLDSTVFAPTNEAFNALDSLNLPSANTGTLLVDSDWTPHLQDFLLYHVLGGSQVFAEQVTDGLTATMLNEEEVQFSVDDEGVTVNTASVVIADVSASNGVIHAIDQVLVPSWVSNSIVDRAVNDGDLSTLVTLVTLADLVETLDGQGKFTVFAPTDDAFNALLGLLNVGVEYFEENVPFLTEVLTYHVLPGIVSASELGQGRTIPTVQGERLRFGSSNGVLTVKWN
jgi:transforming growth factor-beta-induced protein